jgi:hypothetical protein
MSVIYQEKQKQRFTEDEKRKAPELGAGAKSHRFVATSLKKEEAPHGGSRGFFGFRWGGTCDGEGIPSLW